MRFDFKQPDFLATSTNLCELDELTLPITKNISHMPAIFFTRFQIRSLKEGQVGQTRSDGQISTGGPSNTTRLPQKIAMYLTTSPTVECRVLPYVLHHFESPTSLSDVLPASKQNNCAP